MKPEQASVATLVVPEMEPPAGKISAEDALVDQTTRMSTKEILITFAALQSVLLLAFVDQTSVTTILPYIADDLGAADRISWVGTSFLIATLSSQMAISRLSDIWGRVPVLLSTVGLFAFGDLLCGFARNAVWLFCCRGIAGIGAGGIISLSMVVVSDIVPLKDRGKFQGFTGCTVAFGSAIGPLIGGALAKNASWRYSFWLVPPICACLMPLLWWKLPQPKIEGDAWMKMKQIDYLGIFLVMALSIMLIVPLSGGGTIYAWNSPLVIGMLSVGVLLLVAFIISQWKFAKIPILPLRIFKIPSVTLILASTFFQGGVYYGLQFYLPTYFQEVLGKSSVASGVLILPMTLGQPITITLCGQFTSMTGYVVPLLQVGYAFHLLALGLMYRFTTNTSIGYIIGILVLVGLSIGMTLQTSLVGAQAAAPDRDRAVITGARNTARSFGGGLMLAMFGTMRNNLVSRNLAAVPGLSPSLGSQIVGSGVASVESQLDTATLDAVRGAVADGLGDIWLAFLPLVALAFICSCFVKNQRIEDEPALVKSTASTDVSQEKV